MKLLLYRHALRRYALPPWQKYALNQLVYVGDEFQNAITASHDGTSDFNVIDRLRDCMLMLVVSAQAFESLIPPQTKEQAEVLVLNLKNLVMYRAASEADALRCANALGKHWIERATRTVHLDHTAHTYQRVEEYRIKPHEFRACPITPLLCVTARMASKSLPPSLLTPQTRFAFVNPKPSQEITVETLLALRKENDAVRLITDRLRVKEMGPADHIRTKHEVKAFVESGDLATARVLLERSEERRSPSQKLSEKVTHGYGQRP